MQERMSKIEQREWQLESVEVNIFPSVNNSILDIKQIDTKRLLQEKQQLFKKVRKTTQKKITLKPQNKNLKILD